MTEMPIRRVGLYRCIDCSFEARSQAELIAHHRSVHHEYAELQKAWRELKTALKAVWEPPLRRCAGWHEGSMARARNYAGAKRPNLPKCADCGHAQCHAVRISEDADGLLTSVGYVWLCGSCEFLRLHPDAPPPPAMPGTRTLPLQKERLFDDH